MWKNYLQHNSLSHSTCFEISSPTIYNIDLFIVKRVVLRYSDLSLLYLINYEKIKIQKNRYVKTSTLYKIKLSKPCSALFVDGQCQTKKTESYFKKITRELISTLDSDKITNFNL